MSNNRSNQGKYDDIINLPNHRSKTRPPLPMSNRAAQFAPFAALSGHDEAIKETARLTDKKIQLTEDMKNYLATKLFILKEHLTERPEISVTYFQPDQQKPGGTYLVETGIIKTINQYQHALIMENNIIIPIDDIIAIDGDLFHEYHQY